MVTAIQPSSKLLPRGAIPPRHDVAFLCADMREIATDIEGRAGAIVMLKQSVQITDFCPFIVLEISANLNPRSAGPCFDPPDVSPRSMSLTGHVKPFSLP